MKHNNTFSSISKTLSVEEKTAIHVIEYKKIFYKFLAIISCLSKLFSFYPFFPEHQISILFRDIVHKLPFPILIFFLFLEDNSIGSL
mgnify:CR=1 FL=1